MPASVRFRFLSGLALGFLVIGGCGNGGSAPAGTSTAPQTAPPSISTTAAQNGAMVITLAAASGARVYYTIDGSTPTTSSQIYEAPFLVASNLTIRAIAVAAGSTNSNVSTRSFAPNIPAGTLVWSDEFNNATGSNAQPDPSVWTYDTGASGWGNNELEDYCGW